MVRLGLLRRSLLLPFLKPSMVILLILLVAFVVYMLALTLYCPRPRHSLSRLEAWRQRDVKTLLLLIGGDPQTRREVGRLVADGKGLNEAIASVTVRRSLWRPGEPRSGEVPVLQKQQNGQWRLVDVWGNPYNIQRSDGDFILVPSGVGRPPEESHPVGWSDVCRQRKCQSEDVEHRAVYCSVPAKLQGIVDGRALAASAPADLGQRGTLAISSGRHGPSPVQRQRVCQSERLNV